MHNPDIRWKQRFSNFNKAVTQLDDAMTLAAERPLTALEKQGVIQAFEYTYELAWNLLQDYLRWQGSIEVSGPRDIFRAAFAAGLVADGERWMSMIQDRNLTSHTYNEATAEAILRNIRQNHHGLFMELKYHMDTLAVTS